MTVKYFSWLAQLCKRISLARFMLWQSQFLTKEGLRHLLSHLAAGQVERFTFVRQGIRWTTYVGDRPVGMALFYLDDFERANVDILLAWMRAHGRSPHQKTILEIGANIGTSTIPFLLDTNCRVISIEPVPRTRELLELNLRQNGLAHRTQVIPCAIADANASMEMIVPLHVLGGAELAKSHIENPEKFFNSPCEHVTVPARRLDELLAAEQIAPTQVEFVWSDTQGSEGAVIRTGAPLWQAGVPLWVEIEPHLIARQDNLEQFYADAARYFSSFIPNSSLQAQGVDAPPQPIAALAEFMQPFYNTHIDVLLLPLNYFASRN